MRSEWLLRSAPAAAVAATLATTWPAAIARGAVLEPFHLQRGAHPELLVVRIALLGACAWGLETRTDRSALARWAAVAAAFVASLAARGLLVPFVAIALAVLDREIVRSGLRLRAVGWRPAVAGAIAIVGVAVASRQSSRRAPPLVVGDAIGPDVVADARLETLGWIARENLFRGQYWARRWAAEERDRPSEGQLMLSRIEWELGHRDEARRGARAVVQGGAADDVRRRAIELETDWARASEAEPHDGR